FEGNADALGAWLRQFPHVLVDEFQDVNSVQYRLVKLWAGDGMNLFVIGDPDQAIYGFRGADHRFFGELQKDFPRSQRLALDTSYRCAEPILAAALEVIRKPPGRADVPLSARRKEGVKPRIIDVASETAEGIAVVHEISRMVGGATMLQSHEEHKGRSFADIAVLFRTGQQADKLEECFLKEGIPYRVVGQRSFLEAKSVREALTFFRCVTNPDDRFRFLQCLSLSRFDPSGKLAQAMKLQADPQTLSHPLATQLKAFKNVLEEHRARVGVERPEQALARWAEEGQLQDDEDMKRLARLAAGFEDMKAFLQRVLLCQEAECERVSGAVSEAVNLMTLHAAKGLEFPVVFIAGVEDGLIPMRKRDSDLDEERRLFYVGLTRAKDDLILLTARSRTEHGKVESRAPSPFLEDIPDGLLEREKVARKRKPDDGQLKLF
ncbi:MAG: ATP-dependent helicase, partial [Planctomycetes bacterium]|nr:ATP-dependent helicase [Planctomycetota bacterium]